MDRNRPLKDATSVGRLVRTFQEFARLEASGGILLIGCMVVAIAWANSRWSGSYFHLWHTDPTFGFAGSLLSKPLHFWINDGLMALFFLLVGLEIKREAVVGELGSFRKAALVITALATSNLAAQSKPKQTIPPNPAGCGNGQTKRPA